MVLICGDYQQMTHRPLKNEKKTRSFEKKETSKGIHYLLKITSGVTHPDRAISLHVQLHCFGIEIYQSPEFLCAILTTRIYH